MKKKLAILLIVCLGLALRTYNYLGRTAYGWDQQRDLRVLAEYHGTKHLPLLGPIVRGDIGGFYLGPWYHYLLIPGYELSGGNLHVLVWISIGLDVLVIALLGWYVNLAAALLWAVSSMLINSALTPWNVSLMHLWVLIALIGYQGLKRAPTWPKLAGYAFLLGVVTSVHLTLWPLAAFLGLLVAPLYLRAIWQKPWSLFPIALAACLSVAPLVVADLLSGGVNVRAFKLFLTITRTSPHVSLTQFLPILGSKFDATVSRLFLGSPHPFWGWFLAILSLGYLGFRARTRPDARLPLAAAAIVFGSLIVYRDPDFAEYYFNGLLISLVMGLGWALSAIPKRSGYLVLGLLAAISLRTLSVADNPYGLATRRSLMQAVAPFVDHRAALTLLLPDYQQVGFAAYLRGSGVELAESSRYHIVVAPAAAEHVSAPPATPSIVYQTSRAAYRVVVFSN